MRIVLPKITFLMFILFLFVLPYTATGQEEKKTEMTTEQKEKKKSKFEELTEKAEKIEGFFTFYRKNGKLYLAIPKDRLNQEFLLYSEIAKGVGAGGLFGGTMLDIFEGKIVALEKHDGKIFLVQKPHRYKAANGTPEAAAVDLTFGSSVLASAKIETDEEDSIILADVYSWFVSDLSHISNRVKFAVSTTPGRPGNAAFDKSRSYLESVKSFPKNSGIQVKLTFKNNERRGIRSVPDTRYIPISIHYNLAQLPEEPMTSRMGDDRVGQFLTVHKDFTKDDEKSFFKRFVNRWRLECADLPGSDGLCNVKKPIVYYIDHTVPKQYRQTMMEAVEAWNAAFETAGFRNGIKAEMLPQGADPADIRYATLRWNTSDQSGYGAIGPSVVDPRTGEILDADILFEANMLLGFKNTWRNYIDPVGAINNIFEMKEEDLELMSRGFEIAGFADEMAAQGDLLKTFLVAKKEIDAKEPVPQEVIHQYVKWVTMHEVGHSLGLRHNFKSSADTPMDKLHDKNWTEKNGIYGSVMEYPSPNISPKGKKNGFYYSPGIGSYDRWAIAYAYTSDDEKAAQLARQGAKDGHAYGADEDAFGSIGIDPLVNVFDLGEDPLAWGKERVQMIRELYDELPAVVMQDNVAPYELTNAFNSLLFQQSRAMAAAIKYIGGQYHFRDHKGDVNGRAPFVMISKEKQQEALNLLTEYGLKEGALMPSEELLQQFGANRWSHWGNNNTYSGRIDYPVTTLVLSIQNSILGQLLNGSRLARIREAEIKFGSENVVGIPELMEQLTAAIWTEVVDGKTQNISTVRRDLQRAYLERLSKLVTDKPTGTPDDAVAVARMALTELGDEIERNLQQGNMNAYTNAHLLEAQARIEKVLEAGLELKK